MHDLFLIEQIRKLTTEINKQINHTADHPDVRTTQQNREA
jgi:hypothetical protein